MPSPFRKTLGTGLGAGSPVTGRKGATGGPVFKNALQRGQSAAPISLARGPLGVKGYGPGGNTTGVGPGGKTLNVNPSSGQPSQTGVGGRIGR